MTVRASVIIPAWNLWEKTFACLRSLAECSPRDGGMEVMVVDNGSTDATAEALPQLGVSLWGDAFQCIRLPENAGFARACNAGARGAHGEMLFFLNNDTKVTDGWLPPLLAAFDAEPALGAAGPLLLYPDDTIQHCGIAFTPFGPELCHIYECFPADHAVPRKKRPLQAITGAAMMVRHSLFASLGGFNEDYRNGLEDVDFCFALRRAGHEITVVPESRVIHYTSQTPGRFDHDMQNGRLLYSRWGGAIIPDLHYLGGRDGYILAIGPNLDCWLTIGSEDEKLLDDLAAASSFTAAEYEAQLLREPLWYGGWLKLIRLLEGGGDMSVALAACNRALEFFPTRDVCGQMLRLLRLTGQREQLAQFMAGVRNGMERRDAVQLRQRALQARERAVAADDAPLVGILDRWLSIYAAGYGH